MVGQLLSYLLNETQSQRDRSRRCQVFFIHNCIFFLVTFFRLGVDKWAFLCNIYNMMNVILKTNKFSSRRTRNRIREHGPTFRAVKSGNCPDLGDDLHWLVQSEDGWLGWLPQSEFNWQHVLGKDYALCM